MALGLTGLTSLVYFLVILGTNTTNFSTWAHVGTAYLPLGLQRSRPKEKGRGEGRGRAISWVNFLFVLGPNANNFSVWTHVVLA